MTGGQSSWREQAFAVVILALATNAISSYAGASGVLNPDAGSPVQQKIWLAVYLVVFLIFLGRPWIFAPGGAISAMIWLSVAWALASVLWSTAPALTARHAVALVGTTAAGIWLGRRFSTAEIARLLFFVVGAIAIASLVVGFALPQYGRDHLRGDAWSGLFATKNELGRMMALAFVLAVVQWSCARRNRLLVGLVGVTSVALVVLSASRTALIVVLVFAAVVFPTLRVIRARDMSAVAALAAIVGVGGAMSIWVYDHIGRVLGSFGADPTLTGRTKLWSLCLGMLHRHLLAGYGFGGFWRGLDGPSYQVWTAIQNTPPHSHNGLLDAALDLGIIGAGLLVVVIVLVGVQAVAMAHAASSKVDALFPIAVFLFIVFENVTESGFFKQNSLEWLLFVAVACKAEVSRVEARSRAAAETGSRPATLVASLEHP